jgi:broad specificity phosphatase PhoE
MPIFLIRHGETALNAARVVQTPDTPLSAHGLAQAEALGRRLAEAGVSTILSSDLPRALMTAERLRAASGASITLDPGLQERNFGDVRGQAYETIGANILSPGYEPPNGETWAAFHDRVEAAWARVAALRASTGGNLVVVTHGLVCHVLAERHLQVADETPRSGWHNASLTIIDDSPPWRVRVLNCTRHLDAA